MIPDPGVPGKPARRLYRPAAWIGALIALNLLCLTWDGFFRFFNPDDSSNLYIAWTKPLSQLVLSCLQFWAGSVRPAGQLFYRILYEAFGWDPLPFRIACLLLVFANVGLSWAVLRALALPPLAVILATLMVSFHGSLWTVYTSTGTIYDVLCLTFYLLGLLLYFRRRAQGTPPRLMDTGTLVLLTVASFQSKEMGLMLPFVVLVCELLMPPSPGRPFARRWIGQVILPAGLCSVVALLGLRLAHNGVHFSYAGYTPDLSWRRVIGSAQAHLSMLLFREFHPGVWQTVLIALVALALGFVLRNRLMLLGWFYYHVAMAPLMFNLPRQDGYVLYVPLLGVAIYMSALFVGLLDRYARTAGARRAGFVCIVLLVLLTHWLERSLVHSRGFGPGGEGLIRQLTHFAETHHAEWQPGRKIVLVNNPLGDPWQPLYVLSLASGRRDLRVTTAPPGDPASLAGSDALVVSYNGDHYEVLSRTNRNRAR